MKLGNHKLFKNKGLLATMLNFRRNGASLTTLAYFYNCDWTSIKAQCRKYGIYPLGDIFDIERIAISLVRPEMKEDKWMILDGERINKGKTYADYLKSLSP